MKKWYPIVFFIAFAGCTKEQKQQQQEDLVIQAMVNGQWKVTSFKKAGVDITADFSVYKFQFKNNYSVDAINNGSVEKTGTWNANATAQTITSNFTNAVDPLALLNGTWIIQKTTWTSVDANQTVNGETRILHLDKL
ncbi:MAG TPA: hypothetical protein VNS32_19010 [Flavisolibacter sp.]|nr:hypothetical protein [Flavisolibacter sp.]